MVGEEVEVELLRVLHHAHAQRAVDLSEYRIDDIPHACSPFDTSLGKPQKIEVLLFSGPAV